MRRKERSETLTYKLELITSEIRGFPSGQQHERSHKFHFVGERKSLLGRREKKRGSCRGKRRRELQRRGE